MTKLVAYIGLAAAAFVAALGNYWFTFGLWPKSWLSFTLFLCVSMGITALKGALDRENE